MASPTAEVRDLTAVLEQPTGAAQAGLVRVLDEVAVEVPLSGAAAAGAELNDPLPQASGWRPSARFRQLFQ